MLGRSDMPGLWSRSLIVLPDGARDTTTWVAWLQGPTLFVDLRQPAGRPSFAGVRSLGDLNASQIAWLAEQEGFAGRFEQDGEFFVWRRLMDYQPPALSGDSGRLWMEGDVMIEEGRYSPYIEHWHRETDPGAVCAAVRLTDKSSGVGGYLVRVSNVFMYARSGISETLRSGTRLGECIDRASSLEVARELVDCEISFGRIEGGAWMIERSSLPYREGAQLSTELSASEHTCSVADVAADGSAMRRSWNVIELEGVPGALGSSADHAIEFAVQA
jgi:hypothetical protein